MTVRDIDRGWNDFMDNMQIFDDSFVKVGLPENGKANPGEETMSELITIGAANEFGAPKRKIPARPFMRGAFDQNKEKIIKVQQVAYDRVVNGKISVRQGLGLIGLATERMVKTQITRLRTPANAESTIKRKKSSNPLIDSGQLRASIQHKVHVRGAIG